MKKLVVVALMLAVPVAAFAMPEEEPKPVKEKKICRSEKVTGSLTRVRRICMTQAEWDQLAAATKKGVDDIARTASGANGCADAFSGC